MNLPIQPGAGTRDGGAFVRRVPVTESRAQSANFACHPGDLSLHVSLTSSDGAVRAAVMTCDAVYQLATTLGGGIMITTAVSTIAANTPAALDTPASVPGARPSVARHRLHLGHFHRPASIWDTQAEPRRWRSAPPAGGYGAAESVDRGRV